MILGAVIGAAVSVTTTVVSDAVQGKTPSLGEVAQAAVVGAVSGAVSGLVGPEAGPLVKVAVGALASGAGQMAGNAMSGKPLLAGVGTAVAVGALTGGLMEGAGSLFKGAASDLGEAADNLATDATGSGNRELALEAQSESKTLESLVLRRENLRDLTIGVGVLQDEEGNITKVVSTNGRAGTLKSLISAGASLFGQDFVDGTEHAEVNIVQYAEQNNFKLLALGTSRQACYLCTDFLGGYFAVGETNLDLFPRSYRPSLWWNAL
jgi:filamentous hemagglutinin